MGVMNCFLTECRTIPQEETCAPNCKFGREYMIRELTGPRDEPSTITCQMERLLKFSLNSCLYTHRILQLSDHQRCFTVKWMVVNAETNSWSRYREDTSVYPVFSHKRDIYSIVSLSFRDHHGKGAGDGHQRSESTGVEQCLLDLTGVLGSQTHSNCCCPHKTCTSSR